MAVVRRRATGSFCFLSAASVVALARAAGVESAVQAPGLPHQKSPISLAEQCAIGGSRAFRFFGNADRRAPAVPV